MGVCRKQISILKITQYMFKIPPRALKDHQESNIISNLWPATHSRQEKTYLSRLVTNRIRFKNTISIRNSRLMVTDRLPHSHSTTYLFPNSKRLLSKSHLVLVQILVFLDIPQSIQRMKASLLQWVKIILEVLINREIIMKGQAWTRFSRETQLVLKMINKITKIPMIHPQVRCLTTLRPMTSGVCSRRINLNQVSPKFHSNIFSIEITLKTHKTMKIRVLFRTLKYWIILSSKVAKQTKTRCSNTLSSSIFSRRT